MNKISKTNVNSNLRYDGYYLWITNDFAAEWLQFYPNGIVGQTIWEKGEILGSKYKNISVPKSLFYQLIHKFIAEKFPRSEDPDYLPYFNRGKYQIDGHAISFKIDQYDLILTYKGRILKDGLDLLRIRASPQFQDNLSFTLIYEFVAFTYQ